MKKITYFFAFLFLIQNIYSQCTVSAPPDVSINCGASTTLVANTAAVTYSMVTAPCPPVNITGTNAFPTTCDDCVTGQINIGFNFNFYGNIYNTCVIQSNGIVGFGPFTYTGFSPFTIPASGNPNNYIAGFFADIDIRYGGTIKYKLTGTAPNRRFVVSYENVVPYNGGVAGTGTASFQIILNENGSFNTVITQLSANWNSSTSGALATQGAENIDGTYAFVVAGRNSTDWPGITSGQQDCTTFNPSPCVFQKWKLGGTTLTTNPSLTVNPTTTTTYTGEWNCGGTICTDNVVVSINGASITQSSVTNSTNCTTPNGAISLLVAGLNPGTYTMNYLNNGTPATANVTVSSSTAVSQNTTFNTGSFTSSSPTFNRPSTYDCPNSFGTAVYYSSLAFTVSTSGSYTFNNTFDGDGYAHLYQSSFAPGSPCTNLLLSDDDGNGGSDPSLIYNLTAGVTYHLVTTTFSNGTTGNYSWKFTGPGGATISATLPTVLNLTNLQTGAYSNFSIGSGCNAASLAGPINITGPTPPVTTGTTICKGGSGTISTSTVCGVAGTTINQNTNFNTGSLAASDPTYMRSSGGSTYSSSSSVYHDVYSFTVSANGSYTFKMCTPGSNWDGHASIYQNSFNAASPATNFLYADDDGNTGGNCENDAQITLTLSTGVTYYIVTSSFSTGTTGNYAWQYTGPGGATISGGASGGVLQWYTAASGGTSISSANPFNPVGVSGSGLSNTNTPGTTTYYAACSTAPLCRTATTFVITNTSTAATSISGGGAICVGASSTLSVVGGSLATGSVWEWFTGSCGGTPIGTGPSITVTPSVTTTYYVRASSNTPCPATACVSTTVTLPTQGNTLGLNGNSATCLVNSSVWTHFYTAAGLYLGAINSNGQNLGNVTVTVYTGSPQNVVACEAPGYASYALGRRWTFNPQFQPTANVTVLLPFDISEFNSLQTAAVGNSNPNDDPSSIADLKLSKYSGPLNVNGVFADNCPGAGGNGNVSIHSQSASGNVSSILPGFNNNGRYTSFVISSFSEMWLHASSNNVPLPIELESFNGKCEDGNIKLSWKTNSDYYSKKIVLQKLRDSEWNDIAEFSTEGNSNQNKVYEYIDNGMVGINNYYRLYQEDLDGKAKYYEALSVTCVDINNSLNLYPNPNNGNFTLEIVSNVNDNQSVLNIFDVSGKVVFEKKMDLQKGYSSIPLSLTDLSSGYYTVKFVNKDSNFKPISFIIK